MRRTKTPIYTHIYAPHLDLEELRETVSHAQIWSDNIFATCRFHDGVFDSAAVVDTESSTRAEANVALFRHIGFRDFVIDHEAKTIKAPNPNITPVCVVLEPTWLLSDPHVIRDTIELNHGATIFAKRYMMVNDAQYRNDGIYVPIPVAVAYPMRAFGRFSSEASVAPDYAWTSQLRYHALFDILDFQFVDSDTSGGSIRSYEGMVPIIQDHS